MEIVTGFIEDDEPLVHLVVLGPFLENSFTGDDPVGCRGVDAFYEWPFEFVVAEDEVDALEFSTHADEEVEVAVGVGVGVVLGVFLTDCGTYVAGEEKPVDVWLLFDVVGVVFAYVLEMQVGCYLEADCPFGRRLGLGS